MRRAKRDENLVHWVCDNALVYIPQIIHAVKIKKSVQIIHTWIIRSMHVRKVIVECACVILVI
jgi:hypothetical protein